MLYIASNFEKLEYFPGLAFHQVAIIVRFDVQAQQRFGIGWSQMVAN